MKRGLQNSSHFKMLTVVKALYRDFVTESSTNCDSSTMESERKQSNRDSSFDNDCRTFIRFSHRVEAKYLVSVHWANSARGRIAVVNVKNTCNNKMINKISAVPQLVIFIKVYVSMRLRMRYGVNRFFQKLIFQLDLTSTIKFKKSICERYLDTINIRNYEITQIRVWNWFSFGSKYELNT